MRGIFMQPTYLHQKKYEQLLNRFSDLYFVVLKNSKFYDNETTVTNLYHILKKIQSYSAVYHMLDVFHASTFVLSKIQVGETSYHLTKQSALTIKNSLKTLHTYLNTWKEQQDTPIDRVVSINLKATIKAAIVTDNLEYLKLLTNQFDKYNIELTHIESSNVKLELLSQKHPILLYDLLLINGVKLIEEIKENPLLSNAFIIGFHSDFSNQDHTSNLNHPIDMYLPNPYPIEMVRKKLEREEKRHQPLQSEKTLLTLKKEWVRFQRFNNYFSLVFVHSETNQDTDHNHFVDNFAMLYQNYQNCLRIYDEVLIWDTQSFILLLPATTLEGAKLVVERMKEVTHEKGIDSITTTIGLIESEHHFADITDMISLLENKVKRNIGIQSICSIQLQEPVPKIIQEGTRYKILFIDEDPIPSAILQNYLGTDEWDFQICYDGTKALEKTLQWRPDVIICESKLSNFDGFFFCSQLRQNPILRNVRILFLSSQTLNSHVIRGFKVGADDYIGKPFSAEEVGERIRRLFRIQRIGRL